MTWAGSFAFATCRAAQATAIEVLTAEQREYSVYFFARLHGIHTDATWPKILSVLDSNRFSVVPMVQSKEGAWVVGGPQAAHDGRSQYRWPTA